MNSSTRRTRHLPTLSIIAAAAGATFSHTAGASTITISVIPSAAEVSVGDTFTLSLVATLTDVGSNVELGAWGMDLDFDGGLVAHDPLTDVTVDTAWNPFSQDDDGLGGWRIPDGIDPPELVGIALATLEFQATAPGVVTFLGGFDPLVEGFGLVVPGEDAFLVDEVIFEAATVTIIPLPPAVLLGGTGLVAVGMLRRRRLG